MIKETVDNRKKKITNWHFLSMTHTLEFMATEIMMFLVDYSNNYLRGSMKLMKTSNKIFWKKLRELARPRRWWYDLSKTRKSQIRIELYDWHLKLRKWGMGSLWALEVCMSTIEFPFIVVVAALQVGLFLSRLDFILYTYVFVQKTWSK